MPEYGYTKDKAALVTRLHRIEGQVRGIEKMVDEDRYCVDILTQISAATTALESLALQILEEHIRHCVASSRSRAGGRLEDGRAAAGRAAIRAGAVALLGVRDAALVVRVQHEQRVGEIR